MQTMHLFAGAGGGLLADLILGHDPIVAVEWDAYCCQVLRERSAEGWFPNLHVWEGDVRLFDPSEYAGRVGCLHAGFPCQDISPAGKGVGITGEKSGLVSEVFRTIDIVLPEFILLENSHHIRTKGRKYIIEQLVQRGYSWRDGTIKASDFGADHERKRWWLLANSDSAQLKRRSLSCGVQKEHQNIGRPDWWENKSRLERVANGVANQMDRLKAIGNGQVPLQAAAAWKLLGGP